MANTNTDATALDAAANHFLQTERTKRVEKAQAALTGAEQRAAEAEAEHERSCAQLVQHEWDGSRRALLAAEHELTIARAAHAQRTKQLALAKGRWSDADRAMALAKVTAEREWAAMPSKRDAIKKKMTQAAATMIGHARELIDLTVHQQGLGMQLTEAAERFGHTVQAHHFVVPAYSVHVADAILTACRSLSFSPWDWREMDPTKLAGGVVPIAGLRAQLEPIERMHERNAVWNQKLIDEAHANDVTNLETARERAAQR